jgi:lipid-A-disaccharide synthase
MADGLPSVVLYKVNRFDLWIARPFIKAKYISLVNLLADAEVFPEYLTWRDASADLVRWALAWLDGTEQRARTTAALDALRRRVAHPGATDRAAERIVARLARPGQEATSARPAPYRGPHEAGARQPVSGDQGQPDR